LSFCHINKKYGLSDIIIKFFLPSLVIIGFSDCWRIPQSSKFLKPSIETIFLGHIKRLLGPAPFQETGKHCDDFMVGGVTQQDDGENFSKSFENEPGHVFCCTTSAGSAVIIVA
jgi:hypothetical protein